MSYEVKKGAIVEDGARIGDGCIIEYNAVIKSNVQLGDNCYVGVGTVLGEGLDEPLVFGSNCNIRSGSIFYGGSNIGDNLNTGHNTIVRGGSQIGNNVLLSTNVDVQGTCEIGNYTRIYSGCHIGEHHKIGNFCWLFPFVVFTNDPLPPSDNIKGTTVEDYAVICTSTTLLPGLNIAEHSFIGAGSLVTKDTDSYGVYVGSPAKFKTDVRNLKNENGELQFPWPNSFDRGMPWDINLAGNKWSDYITSIKEGK